MQQSRAGLAARLRGLIIIGHPGAEKLADVITRHRHHHHHREEEEEKEGREARAMTFRISAPKTSEKGYFGFGWK